MNKTVFLTLLVSVALFAEINAPAGWGDFQMGLVNNGRVEWDAPMKDAVLMGDQYKLDRRYIYIDDTTNIVSYWTGTKNWSQDSFYVANNVRPGIVIYMLQRGGDSWSAIQAGMNDKVFMEAYFRYIALIADSSKGQQPIYVLEPDVWTYVLQNARESDPNRYTSTGDDWSKIDNNNLYAFCHINDLGFPWLEEFDNKISNLPGAIIKTLKMRDPEAFAGILLGFWGFEPSTTSSIGLFTNPDEVIAVGARETAKFAQALLASTPYKGDFCGLEKNGQDAGFWTGVYRDALFWDDRQNAAWVDYAKAISDSTQLSMVGWQISIGHEGLPNTLNQYEDTFFPYFYSHTQDFIDAGVIGMLAGVAGQGKGTMATPPNGKLYVHPDNYPSGTRGDDGWFYTNYAAFNSSRPWLSGGDDLYYTIKAEVVPDTVVTSTDSKYPAWDSQFSYSYNATKSDTLNHDGNDYVNSGYFIGVGVVPGTAPDKWESIGPSGVFEVTVGGTVDNSEVYFLAGSLATKSFNPTPIKDYGIDSMWVNGVAITPTVVYTNGSLSEDVIIKVKFVPGEGVTPVSPIKQAHAPSTSAVKIMGMRIHAMHNSQVSLYTVSGKKVYELSLEAGKSFFPVGLSTGVYLVKVQSAVGVQTLPMQIGR